MKLDCTKWKRISVIGTISSFSLIIIIYIILTADVAGCSEVSTTNIAKQDTSLSRNMAYQVSLPDTLTFANEQVPLKFFDVRESLDRELQLNTYWHSQTLLLLKRANRFFPVIEPILKEKGIPDDFKYLAVAESALANEVSPSRAVGYWQILEKTGKELGLEINKDVDERYNIDKSTRAACSYLQKNYTKFGNWTMAAASYNYGSNGIDKQIDRQNNQSYYNLVLGEETGRYLYRILAFKVIFQNPKKYGFILDKNDLYPPLKYYDVAVDSSITNIARFAEHFETNYKMLKTMNPWLRSNTLPNITKKKYIIHIPNKDFRENVYQ
ncbi:MAG TPA: murein transglycosylase [Bacteroidales bacterium]|nr:murein transglycosylase [Bacteroidales bacterium]